MAQTNPVYDREPGDQSLPPETAADIQPGAPGRSGGRPTSGSDGGYDPQTTPAGDSSDPRGDLRDAEKKGGLYNPHGDKSPASPGDLSSAESSGKTDQKPGGDVSNAVIGKFGAVGAAIAFARKHKKKGLVGGGIGGVIIGVLLVMLFLLIPLKIEHMVKNLENRFFATSENAVDKQTDKMLRRYIVNRVLPGYTGKNCNSTIDKDCHARKIGSNNPVSKMYNSWSDARLENKLATNYGIEFKRDSGGDWHLKAPGTGSDGVSIGKNGEKLDVEWKKATRKEMRQAIRDATANETRWKKVMYRYKVGRLLEEKYGIKRCIIFCGAKDALEGKTAEKKIAAKLYLIQRVITPRNQTLGITLKCLLSGDSCKPTDTTPTDTSESTAKAGAPENPDVDTKVSDGLKTLAAGYGASNVDELVSAYNEVADKGLQRWLVEKGFAQIMSDTAAQRAGNVVPIAGWLNLASQIINFGNDANDTLKKLRYVTNASAAVDLYMTYRTYADEIHTGHTDPTEIGSWVKSLGPGNSGKASDPIVGGTATAENTPLYSNLISGPSARSSSQTTSLLDELLPSKAYAAANSTGSNSSNDYLCNDGKPVPKGELICPEESLGGGNSYAKAIHDFLNNTPGVDVITQLAKAWRETVGALFSWATDILGGAFSKISDGLNASCDTTGGLFPIGYCPIRDVVNKEMDFLVEAVTKWLIPNPFGDNMSGGRTFDMMAAGADVAGNDYAHTGLGGQKLDPGQVASIVNQQESEARDSFSRQPLFARMFNTDSQYSLVTRVAMAVPFDTQSSVANFSASLLSDPFSAFSHGFASLFSKKVIADTPAEKDPFGVTQYGVPDGDIPDDAEQYWNDHCSDDASKAYMKDNSWNEAAADPSNVDTNTGMPTNTKSNPCLLIKASTGAAGGAFDTSNLTEDDLKDLNGSGGASSGTPANAGSVSGDVQQLAQQVLSNHNISLGCRHCMEDVQNTAHGQPAYSSVKLDIGILQFLLDAASHGNIIVTSITGAGSGHSSGSNHYTGHAIDLNCSGVGTQVTLLNQISSKYHGKNNGERCDAPNPYGYPPHDHYDFFN